ncbi:MAG: histidine kinase [Defluviitaleaceae bacterium]|nr:histidine kinase [Defluviitaleaceae bacterium]
MFVYWTVSGQTAGFFLMLSLACLILFRLRFQRMGLTTIIDGLLCVFFLPIVLPFAIFMGMYYGVFPIIIFAVVFFENLQLVAACVLAALAGVFLRLWKKDHDRYLENMYNYQSGYYEMEALQSELMNATIKIEQMTVISERARISREIHDNAGHEIVAAYISLQTARDLLPENEETADALSLYDAALERLDTGAVKIREAVHNLNTIESLGIENLHIICKKFYGIQPIFDVYGDTSYVPVHIWGVLEACLNEALTNTTRHASPTFIKVTIDATPKLVRLLVENDGAHKTKKITGNGIKNLRRRMTAVGGNVSASTDEHSKIFRLVCVIPMKGK